ncbi:uncharacterized protein LOC111829986 [Capsella rubella]|uniref:uncharacterized protein LOC111829986 n=1 Tax=Capsella rubella TaxID=81985 RepID=UPI000CD4DCA9|nr:uncharacterized protein LOC111829986 [Capsella rubella]
METEEVTYSAVVNKICGKANGDETTTELKLSYVPKSVEPKRPIYIFDDDDVMCYMDMNEDHFEVLHVEVNLERVASGLYEQQGMGMQTVSWSELTLRYIHAYGQKQREKLAAADLRGTAEDSYKLVYCYMHMLEKMNPGFNSMRKVIIVDATSIKNVYGGVLIVASAQDPDHHHYPIAFGVVDSENNASWTWFFSKLKSVIPDCTELVFCSDRHQSLIMSISTVYPLSHHGYCIYHLSQNVKLSCKNVNRDVVATTFMQVAKAYTESEFEKLYADFSKRFTAADTYLDNHVGQHKWARCFYPGARYNIDTTNTVESINGVFRFLRAYALLPMIDAIVAKLAEWFNKYRKISIETPIEQKLVPFVEKLLHDRCSDAKLLPVTELNNYFHEYSVIGVDGSSYV